MSRCCVDKCSDTAADKIFFTFPASKTLRRKWLEVAPVKGKVTTDSVICNHHFLDHEYEWVRGKTRLKAKVVPSVFNTSQPQSPPKEPRQHSNNVNNDISTTIVKNIPQSTKKKKSDIKNNIEIEQNGGLVKRQEPNSSLDETNKDIEEIITNYQIKQIRPINRDIETEKQNGDTRENGERWNRMGEDMGDVVTIEEDADPVYIEVSVDKGGQGGDCLMVLESVQCEVDPALFEAPQDHSDRKEEPISLLTSSDEDDVIIQEPRIDTVEVSDETDEDDRPLRTLARTDPGRGHRKKSKRKRGKSKVTVDTESVVYLPPYDLTPYHFSSAECRGERVSQPPPTVLRLCGRCGHVAASDAQLARHRRTHARTAPAPHHRRQRRAARPPPTHARAHRTRPSPPPPATRSSPATDARTRAPHPPLTTAASDAQLARHRRTHARTAPAPHHRRQRRAARPPPTHARAHRTRPSPPPPATRSSPATDARTRAPHPPLTTAASDAQLARHRRTHARTAPAPHHRRQRRAARPPPTHARAHRTRPSPPPPATRSSPATDARTRAPHPPLTTAASDAQLARHRRTHARTAPAPHHRRQRRAARPPPTHARAHRTRPSPPPPATAAAGTAAAGTAAA